MKKVKNLPSRLQKIAIGQLIFDHTEWVSLWGFMIHDGQESRMDFILTFDLLNKLLRLSGPIGDQVQMLLVDRIERGVEEPTFIDLTELYGSPLVFDRCTIKVSQTGLQDQEGHWRTDPNCLSVDEIFPVLQKKIPVLSKEAASERNLNRCTEMLEGLYALYLGYLELGFDEESALCKAELEDNLKFKMAYYTWQLRHAA